MCIFGSDSDSDSPTGFNKDVVQLTDANFDILVIQSNDIWLVEFFAPWCGHCRSLAPHWAKAATELKGKVKLGILDATVHKEKAQEYGIKSFPTIKFFSNSAKSPSEAQNYTGGRSSTKIVAWALKKYIEITPAPEPIEIIDEKTFNSACDNKPLCVVSVLPNILDCDANCRNTYLNILKEMGEKYKKKCWGWVWTEGAAQSKLEEYLGIRGFSYPTMAVVSFKKMKFAVLKGSFTKEGIDEFLRDISNGKGKTISIHDTQKPKINKIERWDGKDFKLTDIGAEFLS